MIVALAQARAAVEGLAPAGSTSGLGRFNDVAALACARATRYSPGMQKGGYVYIMTNKPFGILYTGVTADIAARVTAHREGRGSSFCKKWGLKRLVLLEWHDEISDAIAREKAIKQWLRQWKLRFISERNPNWDDLYETING